MDRFCKKFPLLKQNILKNLDNQTFARSLETNRGIAKSVNERFFWIQIIKKHVTNFGSHEEAWREALNKTPIDVVRDLAIAVEQYFEFYDHEKLAPLHIAAEKGKRFCTFLTWCFTVVDKLLQTPWVTNFMF